MGTLAIEAHGLGKKYRLGETVSGGGLKGLMRLMGQSASPPEAQEFWALRDASFRVDRGESIGIVGRNGAGKSTLLKVLSRVTKPTEGRARMHGRVGTLLEVGTGFHAELTGRDNIFLSGTILGMTYGEVARKFDEIVAFAEVEKFIDTPVKRYSSGMYVRLAFAVASFLEPEILIVDEVLAVGDAAFQRKSLSRLNEVTQGEGRSVLFVSHNMNAIRTFCRRVLVLEQGRITFDGPAEQGIEFYLRRIPKQIDVRDISMSNRLNRTTGEARFSDVSCQDKAGSTTWQINTGETAKLRFGYEVKQRVPDLMFAVILRIAQTGEMLTMIRKVVSADPLEPGTRSTIELTLTDLPLRPTELTIYASIGRCDNHMWYDVVDENVDLPYLRVHSDSEDRFDREGIVTLPHTFAVLPTD